MQVVLANFYLALADPLNRERSVNFDSLELLKHLESISKPKKDKTQVLNNERNFILWKTHERERKKCANYFQHLNDSDSAVLHKKASSSFLLWVKGDFDGGTVSSFKFWDFSGILTNFGKSQFWNSWTIVWQYLNKKDFIKTNEK